MVFFFFWPLCSVTKQQAEKSWVTGFLWWKQLTSPRLRWKVNTDLLPRKYWLKVSKATAEDRKQSGFDSVLICNRVGVYAFLCACAYICPLWLQCFVVVRVYARTCVCVCVYSRSDRVNPVVCESELFIVWKPMRPSILSVTNDYLPPRMQTQTSRFSIWTARVVGPCLFYVFTCV